MEKLRKYGLNKSMQQQIDKIQELCCSSCVDEKEMGYGEDLDNHCCVHTEIGEELQNKIPNCF